MNERWKGLLRKSFAGNGTLSCRQLKTEFPGSIRFAQLFNGRIIAEIKLDKDPGDYLLQRCEWYDFDGQLDDGHLVVIRNFRVETTRFDGAASVVLEGFVYQPGFVEIMPPTGGADLFQELLCEVTNLPLYKEDHIKVAIKQAQLLLQKTPDYMEIRQLISIIRAGGILCQIIFTFSEASPNKTATDFAHLVCGLLSFAQRSHVYPVSWQWTDINGITSKVRYQEPIFYYARPTRAIIPADHLGKFVETTIEPYEAKYRIWNLADVQEFYLQAISLQSAWPQSLGFFNAMETFKTAFLHQPGNEDLEFHVPKGKLQKATYQKVRDALIEDSDGFKKLLPDVSDTEETKQGKEVEMVALNSKIRDLTRRAYKPILRRMFHELGIAVDDESLKRLVRLRDQIIHSGSPNYDEGPWKDTGEAWQWAKTFGGTVERTMLAILEYKGKFEAYDE